MEETLDYFLVRNVDYSFDEAIERVTDELKKEGFGVLTEIDVKETLKKRIDVDFRKYKILGACNPKFAHQALSVESQLGVLLPCNVVVQEMENGKVIVSAMNPSVAMKVVDNPEMEEIAEAVSDKIKNALNNL